MNWQVLCLLILVTKTTWAANILYMALTASPSHTIWDKTLANALAKNHQITFVSHSPNKKGDNFTETIIFEEVYEKMYQKIQIEDLFDINTKEQVDMLFEWMNTQSSIDAETQGLQALLKNIETTKYDLIIWDLTTGHFLYPIIEKLNFPPVVVTSAFGLFPVYTFNFGIDVNPSYIPMWMMSYTDDMTFYQRIENFVVFLYTLYSRQYVYIPNERALAEKIFGNNFTSFDQIDKRVSILLSNSDPILDYPRPIPPAVIEVGGLHMKRVEELPKDLKDFMDNSKHGIILFCLGTNVRSDRLPLEKKKVLLEAFSKLKQNVLWKFESDIEDLPKNVIVRKWIPQNEILAHPNIKLFISHGGSLSTQEAMFHGVPVVGIPFFADQYVNVHKLKARNVALALDHKTMTADDIYNTISDVLNNPKYKQNMQLMSKRYKDQPHNALERAVFWVEYTLRQGGAEHLRVAARDMSYVQLFYLDFIALIIVLIATAFYICKKIFGAKMKSNDTDTKIKRQ